MQLHLRTGLYAYQNNSFFIDGTKFIIKDRKKDLERKPQKYLLALNIHNKKAQYVSSLYPDGECSYTFDDRKNIYKVFINGSSIEILSNGAVA